MADNGGELTPGQRLGRIETELKELKDMMRGEITALHTRITKHRENNAEQIKELANHIVNQFGQRLQNLEKHDAADDAVKSDRKWFITGFIAIATLMLGTIGLLLQVLGKVN